MYLYEVPLIKLLNFRCLKSHSLFTTLSFETPFRCYLNLSSTWKCLIWCNILLCFFSVRTHAIKFMEMLILTHSKKPTPLPGDYNMKKDDVSIDIVCITFVVRCAIWYHLYNLKNVKNTHWRVLILIKFQALACNFTKIDTPRWVFFTFYIVQMVPNRVTHHICGIICIVNNYNS